MKTKKLNIIIALLFVLISCKDNNKDNTQKNEEVSITKRILSKLHLIDLDTGIIQKQKVKEIYDLLKIVESNEKSIDTVAKSQIFKLFNNDSLAKTFIDKEKIFLTNGYTLDSIGVNNDTILVSLKNGVKAIKRKFIYKMVNDSVVDKNLPPIVIFKILNTEYIEIKDDSLIVQ